MGSLLKNPRFKNENSKAANIKPEPVTETKVTEPKTVSIDFRNNLRRVPPKSNSFKSGKKCYPTQTIKFKTPRGKAFL